MRFNLGDAVCAQGLLAPPQSKFVAPESNVELDPRTLALYTTAISALLAVLSLLYGQARRVYSGYGWWVASLALFSLALGSIGMRGMVPGWITHYGPTVLGVSAMLSILEGQRRFFASSARTWPWWIGAAAIPLLMLASGPNLVLSRAVGAIGVGALAFVAAGHFARSAQPGLRSASLWCAALLVAFGLMRLLRAGWFLHKGIGYDVLESNSVSILNYAVNAIFATLWGFGFMFLCAARVENELDESREALRQLARKDALTGLANRRAFFDDAGIEMARARRYRQPVAMLMIDIDHFKEINDRHGHAAGDRLLASVAHCLQRELRVGDFLARIGGEEFAALLVQTHGAEALRTAERLRAAVESQRAEAGEQAPSTTVSIGVAVSADGSRELEDLLRGADDALYRSKHAGRNRVHLES